MWGVPRRSVPIFPDPLPGSHRVLSMLHLVHTVWKSPPETPRVERYISSAEHGPVEDVPHAQRLDTMQVSGTRGGEHLSIVLPLPVSGTAWQAPGERRGRHTGERHTWGRRRPRYRPASATSGAASRAARVMTSSRPAAAGPASARAAGACSHSSAPAARAGCLAWPGTLRESVDRPGGRPGSPARGSIAAARP